MSHYATNLENLRNLAEKSAQYRRTSDRLANGKKFQELSAYRTDLPDVLTFQRTIERAKKDGYRINKVLAITNSYEIALRPAAVGTSGTNRVEGLQGHIEPFLQIIEDGLQPQLNVQSWRDNNGQSDFDNRLRAIQTLLNTKVGERYIFAGNRYTAGPPVRDITSLVDIALPSDASAYTDDRARNIPSAASNRVADHDVNAADAPTGANGEIAYGARANSIIHIEERQSIEYGSSSSSEPVNQLLFAVRLVKRALEIAPSDPDAETNRRTLLNDAELLFDDARDGLRTLRQRAAAATATLQVAQARQREIEITTQTLADRITSVDTTQAGVELSALAQQFAATLQVIETRNSLSLVNIL